MVGRMMELQKRQQQTRMHHQQQLQQQHEQMGAYDEMELQRKARLAAARIGGVAVLEESAAMDALPPPPPQPSQLPRPAAAPPLPVASVRPLRSAMKQPQSQQATTSNGLPAFGGGGGTYSTDSPTYSSSIDARSPPHIGPTVYFQDSSRLLPNESGFGEGANPRVDIYRPTTTLSIDSNGKHHRNARLADVYSNSSNTAEFTQNFGDYLTTAIPPALWTIILLLVFLGAFILILMGVFNLTFCTIQPMIPVWLLVMGSLLIICASIRIYALWSVPNNTRRRRGSLSGDLCLHAIEGFFALALIVWIILGAVWVYGNKPYVQFNEYMFEEHYCDSTLYWFAFITVTAQLILVACGLLAAIAILCYGMQKEAAAENDDKDYLPE